MKNKILIFMMMFMLLLGLGVPDQVRAGELNTECPVTFDKDSGCLISDTGTTKTISSDSIQLIRNGYNVLVFSAKVSNKWFCYLYFFEDNYSFSYWSPDETSKNTYFFISDNGALVSTDILNSCYAESYVYYTSGSYGNNSSLKLEELTCDSIFAESYSYLYYNLNLSNIALLYSDGDIVDCEVVQNDTIYTVNLIRDIYSFDEWCSDAGLSCAASSNESDSVVPFFYEPEYYNYIVRKCLTASNTSGVYQVSVIQKSDGAHYPYYFEVNDIGYLGVAGSFASTSIFTFRNYYYDADGNGWKRIERFDISTLPFDNTNVTFTDNYVFIYSDTNIYADREATSIWQPASTEYYNVVIPEPEITRVPAGDNSGTTVGGQAEPGGMLDFIITFFTLVWTKLFAVEVPVDGYNISFQSIVIFGAVAGVLIWLAKGSFGKKG